MHSLKDALTSYLLSPFNFTADFPFVWKCIISSSVEWHQSWKKFGIRVEKGLPILPIKNNGLWEIAEMQYDEKFEYEVYKRSAETREMLMSENYFVPVFAIIGGVISSCLLGAPASSEEKKPL